MFKKKITIGSDWIHPDVESYMNKMDEILSRIRRLEYIEENPPKFKKGDRVSFERARYDNLAGTVLSSQVKNFAFGRSYTILDDYMDLHEGIRESYVAELPPLK
jgi:hypothetical protein